MPQADDRAMEQDKEVGEQLCHARRVSSYFIMAAAATSELY